jgi:exocyst complex component 2
MESTETKLLSKYNITTLFPAQWPSEKDLDSDSSDSDTNTHAPPRISTAQPIRRSKSRYSVLESGGSFRRSVPGAEKTREGVENLVQKDESDPLGSYPSVVQVLRQRGLPVEEDVKLSMLLYIWKWEWDNALIEV